MVMVKNTIRSVLHVENELSEQLDSLEVMAEMLGYTIYIGLQEDGVHCALFTKGDTSMFKMTLAPLVKFVSLNEAIDDKLEKLKQEGKLKVYMKLKAIELKDGLVIAQSLL